jgi:RNA polymerase-associated protein RTF1
VCSAEDVKVPTKQDLEKKAGEMQKLVAQPMTEGDISAMLARKSQLQVGNREGMSMLERSRLMQERTLALRRQDYEEVTEIDAKLEEARSASPVKRHDSSVDLLAKVNERNRKANVEAVRRAEIAETERKRRERKLAGRPTPTPTPTPAGSR